MSIRLLGDRILVEKDKAKDITSGGIILPEMARERMFTGKIVTLGRGRKIKHGYIPFVVKVGDHIAFNFYSGTDITYQNKKFVIIHEEDVLCVLED